MATDVIDAYMRYKMIEASLEGVTRNQYVAVLHLPFTKEDEYPPAIWSQNILHKPSIRYTDHLRILIEYDSTCRISFNLHEHKISTYEFWHFVKQR